MKLTYIKIIILPFLLCLLGADYANAQGGEFETTEAYTAPMPGETTKREKKQRKSPFRFLRRAKSNRESGSTLGSGDVANLSEEQVKREMRAGQREVDPNQEGFLLRDNEKRKLERIKTKYELTPEEEVLYRYGRLGYANTMSAKGKIQYRKAVKKHEKYKRKMKRFRKKVHETRQKPYRKSKRRWFKRKKKPRTRNQGFPDDNNQGFPNNNDNEGF